MDPDSNYGGDAASIGSRQCFISTLQAWHVDLVSLDHVEFAVAAYEAWCHAWMMQGDLGGGQGYGLGVRHTCSWWGYLQQPCLWLQPGLRGVGVNITLFQALFEGVTPGCTCMHWWLQ